MRSAFMTLFAGFILMLAMGQMPGQTPVKGQGDGQPVATAGWHALKGRLVTVSCQSLAHPFRACHPAGPRILEVMSCAS